MKKLQRKIATMELSGNIACKIQPKKRADVASPGIEPGSGASETLILSIVLRGRYLLIIGLLVY